MEPHQYERIFNACLVADEFLKEYPEAKFHSHGLPLDTLIEQQARYKLKLRKFKSNMSKLLNVLLEHKEEKYGNAYYSPKSFDFYCVVIIWLFERSKPKGLTFVDNIEHSDQWYHIWRDAASIMRPARTRTVRAPNGRLVHEERSEEETRMLNAHMDQFDALLRMPKEQRLKHLVVYKMKLA